MLEIWEYLIMRIIRTNSKISKILSWQKQLYSRHCSHSTQANVWMCFVLLWKLKSLILFFLRPLQPTWSPLCNWHFISDVSKCGAKKTSQNHQNRSRGQFDCRGDWPVLKNDPSHPANSILAPFFNILSKFEFPSCHTARSGKLRWLPKKQQNHFNYIDHWRRCSWTDLRTVLHFERWGCPKICVFQKRIFRVRMSNWRTICWQIMFLSLIVIIFKSHNIKSLNIKSLKIKSLKISVVMISTH